MRKPVELDWASVAIYAAAELDDASLGKQFSFEPVQVFGALLEREMQHIATDGGTTLLMVMHHALPEWERPRFQLVDVLRDIAQLRTRLASISATSNRDELMALRDICVSFSESALKEAQIVTHRRRLLMAS
jgi:hypothetical protein